MMHGQKNVKL